MDPVRVPLPLRARLGTSAADAVEDLLNDTGREWRDEVTSLVEARFERRLTEALSDLKVGLREEMATTRIEMFKWSFLFWIGQVVTLGGLMIVVLRSMLP